MKELIEELIRDEGVKLFPYKDTEGHLTIGIGHNLERGISLNVANYMLREDVDICILELDKAIPAIFSKLNIDRQNVLINMCFNLGINRFLSFKKMLLALERRDYKQASIEMLDSKWSSQVGMRATRLARKMEGV